MIRVLVRHDLQGHVTTPRERIENGDVKDDKRIEVSLFTGSRVGDFRPVGRTRE